MQRHPSLLILVAGAACSSQPSVTAPPETRAERLAMLDRIASECRVPRAMMELVGEGELRLRPRPDEAYERVDCVLRRLDSLNLPAGGLRTVGVVGNESSAPAANNAAAEASNAQAH